jgi:hypothetical protein
MPITESELGQFTGSENWYQHGLIRRITFTDGAKYLADNAGAYWLIDAIAISQMRPRVRAEEFQVWTLTVKGSKAKLTCEDGNGNQVYLQRIGFTDFPLPEVKLWFSNNVIMLPSEY